MKSHGIALAAIVLVSMQLSVVTQAAPRTKAENNGNEVQQQTTDAQNKKTDSVSFEVVPASGARYNSIIEVKMRIDSSQPATFSSRCVELPSDLCPLYKDCQNGQVCKDENVETRAGRPYIGRIWLQPKSEVNLAGVLKHPEWRFLLVARDWPIWIVAKKVVAGNEEGIDITTESGKLILQPEFMAMVIGAALGSILLSVFLSLKIFLNQPNPEMPAASGETVELGFRRLLAAALVRTTRTWTWVLKFAARAVYFSVVTLMLLLIARVTTGFESPVNVEIKDFWGGIALALFAIPVSRWLESKLQ